MKKVILSVSVVLSLLIAISTGCANNNTTTPAGPTATATAVTSAGGVNISVSMQMLDNNGMIGTEQFVIYAADNLGATLNVSSIALTGPTGALTGTITSSVYSFTAFVTTDYVPAGSYTVTVGYNAVNYTGTFSLPGNMTISSDGNTVSWAGTATAAMITIIKPDLSSSILGPFLTSPYDLSSVYTAGGAGNYTVTSAVTIITPFSVNNGGTGIATSLQTRMKMLVKS